MIAFDCIGGLGRGRGRMQSLRGVVKCAFLERIWLEEQWTADAFQDATKMKIDLGYLSN